MAIWNDDSKYLWIGRSGLQYRKSLSCAVSQEDAASLVTRFFRSHGAVPCSGGGHHWTGYSALDRLIDGRDALVEGTGLVQQPPVNAVHPGCNLAWFQRQEILQYTNFVTQIVFCAHEFGAKFINSSPEGIRHVQGWEFLLDVGGVFHHLNGASVRLAGELTGMLLSLHD